MGQLFYRFQPSSYFFVTATLVLLSQTPVWPANVDLGGGNRFEVQLKSLKELRDQNVVKQAYEYSCGGAALATLLTYALGDTVTELEILEFRLASLTREEQAIRKQKGFSLFDLQYVAEARGHKADGFWSTPEALSKFTVPLIVFIQPRGYKHFAVFRGIHGNRVYLADPSLGNVRIPKDKFLEMWLDNSTARGTILLVEKADGTWPENHLLKLRAESLVEHQILTMRQMMEIGNHYVRFPQLFR